MGKSNLPMKASAVLAWLPKGQNPAANDFDPADLKPPPRANPDGWWYLHQAITYAAETTQRYDKLPWIKVGEEILSPDEIQEIYRHLGNLAWIEK